MELSRRDFVLLGLTGIGALMAGCAPDAQLIAERPAPAWPDLSGYPRTTGRGARVNPETALVPGGPAAPELPHGPPIAQLPPPTGSNVPGPIDAIPRARWAEAAPVSAKILAMGDVERITVHHEGWTPVYFADVGTTAKRLEAIRKAHLERLHAGDIGYHYVIDRAGRIWQGRDIRYQGAHVRDHNPHNIGVMCLGNFDLQRPTDAQLATLRPTLASLMRHYHVSLRQVFTHQELNPTECPGTSLQGSMVTLRRGGIV